VPGARPQTYRASLTAARDLLAARQFESAERMLRELATPEATALLARSLSERGRRREARELLEGVLRKDPNHYEALHAMADLCRDAKEHDLAIAHYRRMASIDAADPRPLREMARCFAAKGDRHTAMACAQQALALSPDDEEMMKIVAESVLADASAKPQIAGARPANPAAGVRLPRPEDHLPRAPRLPEPYESNRTHGTSHGH
jgi:tetratricopeptide (TPR) repeat protein